MKKRLYLFCLLPTSVVASAPFGVRWGQNLTDFGNVVQASSYQYVITNHLPEPYSLDSQYTLIGDSEVGLKELKIRTKAYRAFSADLASVYDEANVYLKQNGYKQVSETECKLSSYQCTIHGVCEGQSWSGIGTDGTTVLLKKTGVSRSSIFVSISFSASL